jgi:hypothetical protein
VDYGTFKEGSFRYNLSRALERFSSSIPGRAVTICEAMRQEINYPRAFP